MSQEEIEKLENSEAVPELHEKLMDEIIDENQKSSWLQYTMIGLAVVLVILFSINWLFTSAPEATRVETMNFLSKFFDKEVLLTDSSSFFILIY